MSVWTRIGDALSALRKGESLASVFDKLRAPPERSVAFAIAVVALGAKMAKADGRVTRNEVTAFREVFQIARDDEAGAARVFNLARQDVAGYEEYARRIKTLFGDDSDVFCDLMEGLFHIALADGAYHPNEDAFLGRVAEIFGIPEQRFRALRARFLPDAECDPYTVLGVSPDTPIEEIRRVWRQAVRDTHPDRMIARGVPEEAVKLAERRMVDINRAWEEISGKAA
ncbi:DnaJ like chaperone protein [Salinihabitans flavidus]|uniref:DnaJ like chaperone protein n=1 Tax=Salinihabitans flavidus TaxID=569882 RepID=A0A1H8UDM3_9RHOB|nr:molecular chaperone DjiA [Salinihabitans flavidus]SEP01271.1 DnaJ like chaperone protein [Salinihabitans flavidus]